MEQSYRIKANVGKDQVLNVNLKQDIDIYEILSLKLNQENIYKLYPDGNKNSSMNGVIVGRVLANEAFGVPNVKVTVFIPISDVDALRQDIRAIYPYNSVTDANSENVKFNTLPNYKKFEKHQEVGSFPKKQLVLDEDSVLEVYDKYYKFTTVTNKAGDYMIFGIPTGEQIIHVDVDLSDIGVLSQEPRDFIYKGYSRDLFESPTQFKKSTNLDSLPQIQNQTATVTVYPLWGDKNAGEIAITRKDINLQYTFEPTCVFIGSVITDNNPNTVSYNCIPDRNVGEAGQMSASKGNIEMIRKTVNDTVEEYKVKGTELIDGDGVWCYQIPMNLDYVGMDEIGNIIATDNPKKGIPTRSRVRFRVTIDEKGNDGSSRHRAKYLIPNNPYIYDDLLIPAVEKDVLDTDAMYEFGSKTPESCFRDLYWNKVYSVKNYIPRIQMSKIEKSENYIAIKGVNKKDARNNNPIPYNKMNLNFNVSSFYLTRAISDNNNIISEFWDYIKSYSNTFTNDNMRDEIIEETDAVGLDFYNDWLNGCLYFPSWHWRVKQKKLEMKGNENNYDNDFCECTNNDDKQKASTLYLYNNCSLVYENNDMVIMTGGWLGDDIGDKIYRNTIFEKMFTSIPFGSKNFYSGIIKKVTNKDGLDVFYYSFGNKLGSSKPSTITDNGHELYEYARLFSTDLILLGSLKDCDIDGVPKIVNNLPSTTSNIPPYGRYIKNEGEVSQENREQTDYSYNGMNWDETRDSGGIKFGAGLFFGMTKKRWKKKINKILRPYSDIKTCINLERISELGTNLDADYLMMVTDSDGNLSVANGASGLIDGLITEKELEGIDLRAWFATLNFNKLVGVKENTTTGYKTYLLTYFYPTNFDGRLGDKIDRYNKADSIAGDYTFKLTKDDKNRDYLDFRFGSTSGNVTIETEKNTDVFTENNSDINGINNNNNEPRGGKRARTRGGTIDREGGSRVNMGDVGGGGTSTNYTVGEGSVTYTVNIGKSNRHFYGYKLTDNVTPLIENTWNFTNYPYAFPLYNNSFYFYFGINQGSTAIDKFYENFYS